MSSMPVPPPEPDAEIAPPAPDAVAEEQAAGAKPAAPPDEFAELAGRPLAEHPEVYERIHAQLREALSGIDDA